MLDKNPVPTSRRTETVITFKTDRVMMLRYIRIILYETNTKATDTLYGRDVTFVSATEGLTCSSYWAFNRYRLQGEF